MHMCFSVIRIFALQTILGNFETNIVLAPLGQIWINLNQYELLIITFATGILIAFQ